METILKKYTISIYGLSILTGLYIGEYVFYYALPIGLQFIKPLLISFVLIQLLTTNE